MTKVYSTQELIEILADERRACLNGQRLNLTATATGVNPVIDKFLRPDGIQKFTAYQDFKATIHRYQREYQVSGIVWQHLTVEGQTLRYPVVDDQLIALDSDLEILKQAQPSVLSFWQQITPGLQLYLSVNHGKDYRPIQPEDLSAIATGTEWATLSMHGNGELREIILQLGWGKPEEAAYKRGWPISGSEYIHAVHPGRRPIG